LATEHAQKVSPRGAGQTMVVKLDQSTLNTHTHTQAAATDGKPENHNAVWSVCVVLRGTKGPRNNAMAQTVAEKAMQNSTYRRMWPAGPMRSGAEPPWAPSALEHTCAPVTRELLAGLPRRKEPNPRLSIHFQRPPSACVL
jgi:hypothetical protein